MVSEMETGVTYADIRPTLKTGDIILFSGKGGISSLIKRFSNSKWSHVGMVVRFMDMVLLWESTSLSKLKDVQTGKSTQGVQLVGLSERLAIYDGDFALRRLSENLSGAQLHALSKFRSEVAGRPYEKDYIELLNSVLIFENTEDLSSIFCSELLAEAYQRMGLLTEDKPSNEYTPKDFAGRLRLKGLKLGPVEEVTPAN